MALSPVNVRVLASAAVVASPALWLAVVDRTLPLDHALTRFLVAVGLSWVALNVVAEFFFPPATAADPRDVEGAALAQSLAQSLAPSLTPSGAYDGGPQEPAPYEPAPYESSQYDPVPYDPGQYDGGQYASSQYESSPNGTGPA